MTRFRNELAKADLLQLAPAIIEKLGIRSVDGLREFTFDKLEENLKAAAGVTLKVGHIQKLKAFLATSSSGTSEGRMPGGPKVTSSALDLQPNAKRRSNTKHADAKLMRSLTSPAMLSAQVKKSEAGENDVESPHLDTSSAASGPGSGAPGRFHSRRRRDSFAEDRTMEAASKSEHPSGRKTGRSPASSDPMLTGTTVTAVLMATKLRRRAGGDKTRHDLPPPSRPPRPGAVGSGRMDHKHGIVLQDLDSRPAPLERGASATRNTPTGPRQPSLSENHDTSGREGSGREGSGWFVVTFHLSTFDEVAPLTAASLQGKAEAVKEKLTELGVQDIEIVKGKPFLPRCQDMPEEAFLLPERAAVLFEQRRRGVKVGSYCWRMPGMPDPDGRTLEKMRGYMRGRHGEYGLFVDVACLPQNFAWPSWHAPEAKVLRFGPEVEKWARNGNVEGPLTVLKFEWERVATEDEAQVCVDKLVALCEEKKWVLTSMADFESLGLQSRGHASVLFHGRYKSGVYHFDKGANAEGYVRFRTADGADAAQRHPDLKLMCGGKEPILMGEHVFENELKFKRGLSVMGCLYASATGTCVLQLTDPPGKLGKEVAPDELVSERTGTVFVVRTNMSLEELREELGNEGVLACEKKGWGEVLVRVLGERAARDVRLLKEGSYPLQTSAATRFVSRITCGARSLRRKDPMVYPMYNLRPYGSRGWPTFETSAASIVLAHLTQLKRLPKKVLSDKQKQLLESLEVSGPKLMNIDVIGAPREVEVKQSPEQLLRQCKRKLRSKQIFFTGNADRKVVIQLLSDFEDSIAVQFDQKRAEHLNLRSEDLDQVIAEVREARRSRFCKLLQRLTFHEEPMTILNEVPAAPLPQSLCSDGKQAPMRLLVADESGGGGGGGSLSVRATQASVIVMRGNGDEKRGVVQDLDKAANHHTIIIEGTGINPAVRPAGPQVGSTVLALPEAMEGHLIGAVERSLGERQALAYALALSCADTTPGGAQAPHADEYHRAPGKPLCPYGTACTRKNPFHFEQNDHPSDHPLIARGGTATPCMHVKPTVAVHACAATPCMHVKPTVAAKGPDPKIAIGQRYSIGSCVFLKRSNGEETLAYVKEYDAVKQVYTVELEKLGSMKLQNVIEKNLREANMFEGIVFYARALFSPALNDDHRFDA